MPSSEISPCKKARVKIVTDFYFPAKITLPYPQNNSSPQILIVETNSHAMKIKWTSIAIWQLLNETKGILVSMQRLSSQFFFFILNFLGTHPTKKSGFMVSGCVRKKVIYMKLKVCKWKKICCIVCTTLKKQMLLSNYRGESFCLLP